VTPKAVLDTNVIVSGLGWPGTPARVLDAALAGQITPVTSPPLLTELRRVLAYPKLANVIADSTSIVNLLESASVLVTPNLTLNVVADQSDNRVLEAAVEGAVDRIVSGDNHLLELKSFRGIAIVSAAEFAARFLA
jgi:putative PIN family toxin of toxin-antitoxin system